MVTQGALFKINRETGKSLEKLSTGLRINRASDDAAGLGVSENLRTQVRGISQAMKNTQDTISMLNIAEGALNEMSDIMQRMRELVIQAKNDTYTQTERNYMGDEFEALANELDRLAESTNYNGMRLFYYQGRPESGSSDPKVEDDADAIWDAGDEGNAVFGANDNGGATHFNMLVGQNYTTDDVNAFNGGAQFNSYDRTSENMITLQFGQMDLTGLFSKNANFALGAADGWYVLTSNDNANLFEHNGGPIHNPNFGNPAVIGENEALHNKLNTILQLIDGENLTDLAMVRPWANGTNVTGIERINRMRAYIGAMTNRLEHNMNNLIEAEATQQSAESQIRDADFAQETATFTKNNILTQSATSMLAQANMVPNAVLQLIRG